MTLANTGFERYVRQTRRAAFLDEIERDRAVEAVVRVDCAALSDRRRWSTADSVGTDVAHLLLQQWLNATKRSARRTSRSLIPRVPRTM
jgi:hypothetical protein